MKKGTIDLATALYIPNETGQRANDNSFSVQMHTADISIATDCHLEFSLDGENWNAAIDGSTDTAITLSLADDLLRSFDVDPGIMWRIRFASGSTGTVNYTINDD